ncbi:MAG: hypothetical protein FJX20_05360 [Alphaproteobacteria bacterium]|nr:hypothetical protein [Alphaproteobacteria bacterium]
MHETINRRNALRSAVGLAGSMLLLSSRASPAFSNEIVAPENPTGIVLGTPCESRGRHPAIFASLRRHLEVHGTEGSASQACPYCQCRLTVTRK